MSIYASISESDQHWLFEPILLIAIWFGLWSFTQASAVAQDSNSFENSSSIYVDPAVLAAEQKQIDAIAAATPATIAVFEPSGQGGGSGVLITSDGFALTNFHVVQPCGTFMRCGLPDGKLYDAVLVGMDPVGDVALIKLLGKNDFPVARIGDSDRVRVGDLCFTAGNPFLLATNFQPSISQGIVSGIHRYQYPSATLLEYADCLQTDAAVNPGNSGGPLYDASGALIGINGRCSFEKRGRVNVGVGYAISINQVERFYGDLLSGRIVDHASLGATVNTNSAGAVVIGNILERSDAYRRGLRYADEVIEFSDRSILSVNDFKNVLGTIPPGWRVPLRFRRDGETKEIYVRLTSAHHPEELIELLQPALNPVEPLPDEKPKEKQSPRNPEQTPRRKNERGAEKSGIPDNIAALVEQKVGFANYYFNRLNRNQILQGWFDQLKISPSHTGWLLKGKNGRGEKCEFVLTPKGAAAQLPDGADVIDLKGDLTAQREPLGSGGLLVALHFWHLAQIEQLNQLGDAVFIGYAPIPDRYLIEPVPEVTKSPPTSFGTGLNRFPVVQITRDGIENRVFFDPETHRPVLWELFPDASSDPCELYLGDYRESELGNLPHRFRVRFGDQLYSEFFIDVFEMLTAD